MTELEKGAGLISISGEKIETEVHFYGETFFSFTACFIGQESFILFGEVNYGNRASLRAGEHEAETRLQRKLWRFPASTGHVTLGA